MAAAKTTQELFLSIPKQNMKSAMVMIEGTSPLVTNPFPNKAKEEIKFKQNTPVADQPKKKSYPQRFPWNDFANSGYWIGEVPTKRIFHDGYTKEGCLVADVFNEEDWNGLIEKEITRFGFQVSGIKESALAGAYRLGLVKNLPTARMYFSIKNSVVDHLYKQSVIEIITPTIPGGAEGTVGSDGHTTEYSGRMAPIMREDCLSTFSSGADMRYRMMFENWSMDLEIEYNADFINIETICYWFSLGGMGVGLGENRAEKGGPWGQYRVATKER